MRPATMFAAVLVLWPPAAASAGDLPDKSEAITPAVVQYWQADRVEGLPAYRLPPRGDGRRWDRGYWNRRYGGDRRYSGFARGPDCCAPPWRGYAWSYPRGTRYGSYRDYADWSLAPGARIWREGYRGAPSWRAYAGTWRDPRW
jgi:hypothetical protein